MYSIVGATVWAVGLIQNPTATVNVETNPEPIATAIKRTSTKEIISGQPTRFSIGRLDIDLPVHDGVYDSASQTWTLSTDAVYFATVTTRPNDNRGNTFIYGHNQPQVIGSMQDIKIGDIVTIQTSNNHTFRYAYSHDAIVTPEFTAVLDEDSATPQLTVMTCEGIWSEARRLMYFNLVEVS